MRKREDRARCARARHECGVRARVCRAGTKPKRAGAACSKSIGFSSAERTRARGAPCAHQPRSLRSRDRAPRVRRAGTKPKGFSLLLSFDFCLAEKNTRNFRFRFASVKPSRSLRSRALIPSPPAHTRKQCYFLTREKSFLMAQQVNWMRDGNSRRKVARVAPWKFTRGFVENVVRQACVRAGARIEDPEDRTRNRRDQRSRQNESDPRIRVAQALLQKYRYNAKQRRGEVAGAAVMRQNDRAKWTRDGKPRDAPNAGERCWIIPSGTAPSRWVTGTTVCYHKHEKKEYVFVLTAGGDCHCVPTTQAYVRD
jgi:hypothetical protein